MNADSLPLEDSSIMLPSPFRDFISPHVVPRIRTTSFGLVLGLILSFEVFIEVILEVDDAVLLTKTSLLFDFMRENLIYGKKLTLLTAKLSWTQYCLMSIPDPRPPLWSACNRQDMDLIKCLLNLNGIRDDAAFDGTTGFALSLAQLNTMQTLAILESGIEPRDQILFLAREFTALETDNAGVLALQSAIRIYLYILNGIPDPFSVISHSAEDPTDKRYL